MTDLYPMAHTEIGWQCVECLAVTDNLKAEWRHAHGCAFESQESKDKWGRKIAAKATDDAWERNR